jgi:HlyD family secretion protein
MKFSFTELLKHKYIVSAIVAVVVIGAGAGLYYMTETRRPSEVALPGAGDQNAAIIANGDVEPLQNPNLSFQAGGRVSLVNVKVGDRVYVGETLAALDLATLSAQKAQAQANVAAAEAKLDALKAGPRQTDVAVKESAVNQAKQGKAATYAGVPAALSDAYAKANDAVHSAADSLFSNPNTARPTPNFTTSDSATANALSLSKVAVNAELTTWQAELSALPASSSATELDAALSSALSHLALVRQFEDALILALDSALPSSSFTASQISAAQTSTSAARASVNGLISTLTGTRETLVSEELAIENATASLNQLTAGASPQDIEAAEAAVSAAEASVSAVQAQISQNVVAAPFAGIVGSVSIKAGDSVAPGTAVITILPDSALEVSVAVSEVDVSKIVVGDKADVTLDAYGSGKVFPAHVSEVDAAPTILNGVSSYGVKLSFDTPDASIKTGMTANALIHPNTH